MTWWKVSYDFRRPNWQAYGHTAFVEAETLDEARARADDLVVRLEPGATITRLEVAESRVDHAERHQKKVEAARRWAENVAQGIPNKRGDL